MYMNLFAIAIVGGLGYLWVTRGFFSALINLVCVVAAGALAFAFWEPISLLILEKAPVRGFGAFLQQSAWALGLALPFGISLALLRAVLDKALPNNTVLEPSADYVGGGVCGAGAGIITAGIAVMSLGMLRMDRDLLGYARVQPGTGNSLVSSGRLWIPFDDMVAGLYGRASVGVFASGTPMAHYYPNMADVPELLRSSEGNGKAMNVMLPSSAQVVRRYRVGADGTPVSQLLGRDAFADTNQQVVDFSGEQFPPNSTLQGFVVQFAPAAREKNGQVVIGPAQVRLLVHGQDEMGEIVAQDLFPVAAVSQAAATPPRYARWRFDAPNVFVSSVGGASELLYGFEFVVPPGFQPVAMYVKGVRYEIDPNGSEFRENGGSRYQAYPSLAARDASIPQGSLTGSLLPWTADERQAVLNPDLPPVDDNPSIGISIRNTIGNYIVQKGTQQGLEIDGSNRIVQGQATFNESMLNQRGLERPLRISEFLNTTSTSIVQVDVSVDSPNDLLVGVAGGAQPSDKVQLVDSFGTRYDPLGYIFVDRDLVKIVYFPGSPITSLAGLPSTTRSRPDQRLSLIYRVSAPTTIASFEVGNVVVHRLEEPLEVPLQQGR